MSRGLRRRALPAGWEVCRGPRRNGHRRGRPLTVDGARANTTTFYGPGRSLDFAATFTADPFQHVGSETHSRIALGDVQPGGGVLPRASMRGTWDGWDSGEHADRRGRPTRRARVQHRVDPDGGSLLRGRQPRRHARDRNRGTDAADRKRFHVGGGNVDVEYLDLYAYPSSGTFTSRVFDAGDSRATWRTLSRGGRYPGRDRCDVRGPDGLDADTGCLMDRLAACRSCRRDRRPRSGGAICSTGRRSPRRTAASHRSWRASRWATTSTPPRRSRRSGMSR